MKTLTQNNQKQRWQPHFLAFQVCSGACRSWFNPSCRANSVDLMAAVTAGLMHPYSGLDHVVFAKLAWAWCLPVTKTGFGLIGDKLTVGLCFGATISCGDWLIDY